MAKNTVIILPSDRENWSSIEEQIMQYLDMDPRHRDRIPFLFIEEFQERVLEEPPTWIDSQSVLRRLWKVAGLLALMYKQPLHEAGFLDNVHRSSDRDSEFADEKLARFGAEQKGGDGYDLEYLKKWRRLMQSFLRTASVA